MSRQSFLLCHALCSAGGFADGEDDIQWAPPGEQLIHPTMEGADKGQAVRLRIDAKLAELVESKRAEMQAAADKGDGIAPFFDFNHEDGAASAWPKQFYWGGDDPLTGGIRCKLEWSDAGLAAVKGKAYRRFSPGLYLAKAKAAADAKPSLATDDDGFHIVGAVKSNMGGLVNKPAFSTIQALFSDDAPAETETVPDKKPIMTPEEIAALQDRLTKAEETIAQLQKEKAELETAATAKRAEEAKTMVAAAAKEGRIPAAADVQEIWAKKYCEDPEGTAKLLAAQAPNAALSTVQLKKPDETNPGETKVQAKSGLDKAAEWIAKNNAKGAI